MLILQNISISFGNNAVVKQFNLTLNAGEIACLLGPSGCGKTTVLRSIAGFETPQSGSITLNERDLLSAPAHQRGVGMVFQDYALFPHLSVADNIAFGLHQLSKSEKQARVAELLELIGLQDAAKRYPHQLSGGQQQRVALARALAPKPALILLDEPFSNLDTDLRTWLAKEVRQLLKQQNTAAIMVTHDKQEAFAMADKIGIMQDGCLQQYDTAEQLYHQPANAQVARFIGGGSVLNASKTADGIACALGNIALPVPPKTEQVQIFVRPQDLAIVPNSQQANATISDLDFQGTHYLLTAELRSGEKVGVSVASADGIAAGDAIELRLNNPQILVFED